ncbi:MAG: hypothetical protein R2764_23650 [Bacteroidales bacterium]
MQPLPKYERMYLLALSIFIGVISYSQSWNGSIGNPFFNSWSVNVNAGFTSYYGDLSIYDDDLGKKLSNESGPAYSVIISKQFNPVFAFCSQFLVGELKGKKGYSSFNTSLMEYNFHFRINIKNIIFPDRLKKLGVIGFAGVGQFLFKTNFYYFNDGKSTLEIHDTGVPEFVYFFGGGLHYTLTNKVFITADLSLRHSQNDRLDNVNRGGNYDYYTYISVGISYNLGNSFREPVKNKARIAHSMRRLKPLHH